MGVAGTLKNRRQAERFPSHGNRAFWRGFASAFNFWGDFRPLYYGRDPVRADYDALRSDWETVGRDMERAIRHYELAHAEELGLTGQARLFDPDAD